MLAYVFWHWPNSAIDSRSYEESLVSFHRSLAAVTPEGFNESAVFRIGGAPWIGSGQRGYEDWYLVEGSSALDPLNESAVAGICQQPHHKAAKAAAGGTAGLYRLRQGEPQVGQARYAHWFAKPTGTSYEGLYNELRPGTQGSGVSLWGRQMTLGPTPEFCLLAPRKLELPSRLSPLTLRLEPVWP